MALEHDMATTAIATRSGSLTRLRRMAQPGRKLTVDRSGSGAIRGLSAITTGEALGHGFEIDDTTVRQVAAALNGIPGRWTHGGLSDDGLARHLGHWVGGAVEKFDLCRGCELEGPLPPEGGQAACPGCGKFMEHGLRAVGDFAFSKSAHSIQPDGLSVAAPVYLMDRAEENPRTLGVSVVALFDFEEQPVLAEDGKTVKEIRRLARLQKVPKALARGDFVADPAANPLGLHAGTGALSALSEEAFTQLDKLVERLGKDEARVRVSKFVDRYLALKEESMKVAKNSATAQTLAAELEDVVANMVVTGAEGAKASEVSAELAKKKAAAKKAKADDAEDEEPDDDEDGDEDSEEDLEGQTTCPSCGKKFVAEMSAKLAALEAANKRLTEKFVESRLADAKRRARDAGLPLDSETVTAVSSLLSKGDDASEKLGEHMLRLAVGRSEEKPKAHARLANPGLKTAEQTGEKPIQDLILEQQGYERTANGELKKKN